MLQTFFSFDVTESEYEPLVASALPVPLAYVARACRAFAASVPLTSGPSCDVTPLPNGHYIYSYTHPCKHNHILILILFIYQILNI